MTHLMISDLDEMALRQLEVLASAHGRTAESEAKAILTEVLLSSQSNSWAAVDAIRNRLAASGRRFSDSTELVREDRDR